MSEQEQIKKTGHERSTSPATELTSDASKGEALKAELDSLLDEIDSVLEENAEDFVRNYVQKGGE
jgi:ubiquitin-like protein Pup